MTADQNGRAEQAADRPAAQAREAARLLACSARLAAEHPSTTSDPLVAKINLDSEKFKAG